jgi:AAA15 family ATPase/GTPase
MNKCHTKLREITINNFKTFDDFKIDGLTQINLISGKNNVGKTTFLESCYINLVSHDIEHYISSFIKRGSLEIYDGFRNRKNLDKICINSNINQTAVNVEADSIIIEVNGVSKTYPRYEMTKLMENIAVDSSNINFIPSFPINNDSLSFLFSRIQIARKKDLVNNSLAENFDENIVEFDFILGEPKLFVLNREKGWVPLSEFGEGIKRFLSIICAIWASQDGACFIDEIEDGIHYLHYKKLWQIIFNTTKEANCQIFASTHSKEMIENYYKEAKNLEMKEISFTTLVRDKKNNIKAITYDFDWFIHEMSQNHEVRGW